MNDTNQAKQFDVSFFIEKYWVPLVEMKWIVVACFLASLMISLVLYSLIQPEYETQGTFLVEAPLSAAAKIKTEESVPVKPTDTYVAAEIEKLKSGVMGTEVLKILPEEAKGDLTVSSDVTEQIFSGIEKFATGGMGKKLFDFLKKIAGRKPDILSEREKEIAQLVELLNRLEIKGSEGTGIVHIRAKSFVASAAPAFIRAYTSIWTAINLEDNKRGIRAERIFAEDQRNKALVKYQEAEKELLELKRRYDIPVEINKARDGELQSQLEAALSKVQLAKERFDVVDKAYVESQMKEAGTMGNIRVIDHPGTPLDPSKRTGLRVLITGILVGLSLGIGIVIIIDYLRAPIRHESDIVSAIHLPILGNIPRI